MRHRTARAGFTLIEIMIVVGIIGLLATVIVPNVAKHKAWTQFNMIQQNLRKMEAAKSLWALANHKGEDETPSPEDLKAIDAWPKPLVGEIYQPNSVGTPATATLTSRLG